MTGLIYTCYGQTLDLDYGTNGYIHYSDGLDHEFIGFIKNDTSLFAATTVQEGSSTSDYSVRIFHFDLEGNLYTSWGTNGILTLDIPGYTHTFARTIVLDDQVIRIACEAANGTSQQRELVILELNLDGSFNTDFNDLGYKMWSFDNVLQNNIVKYYQKGDDHLLIGNLYRTFDSETNQYPFIIKLDENLDPDSSFNETGRLVIDNYRGNTNAKPTHLEGGQAEDIYINDDLEIVFAGYELLDPYNDEYVCKLDFSGNYIQSSGMTPYMNINDQIGIFYSKMLLVPEQDEFTFVHSYFTGTKFQFGMSQKTSAGALSYLLKENIDGYHHQLRDYATLEDELVAVGYQYETSSDNTSDEFFVVTLDPTDGSFRIPWSDTLVSGQIEGAEQIIQIDSMSYLIGGFSQHPDSNYRDLVIAKLAIPVINSLFQTATPSPAALVVNPVYNKLKFSSNSQQVQSWELLNYNGGVILSGISSVDMNIEHLPKGTYLIRIHLKNGVTQTQRIMIR